MAHTLPGAGSVGWTMTTANRSAIFQRHSEEEHDPADPGAARMGKWTFTPASSDRAQDETAALHLEGLKIELNYSSSIFEDFLEAMSSIRNEFNRRSQDEAASGVCGTEGRWGQESLV
ncbi:hypothetical protein ACFY0N_39130 [Streptomyces vinaceus]|uniref:hypothetical protein n=1 Tax=Streptomyces vinaceus TaxID=1960 RepID=UPI0035D709D1